MVDNMLFFIGLRVLQLNPVQRIAVSRMLVSISGWGQARYLLKLIGQVRYAAIPQLFTDIAYGYFVITQQFFGPLNPLKYPELLNSQILCC